LQLLLKCKMIHVTNLALFPPDFICNMISGKTITLLKIQNDFLLKLNIHFLQKKSLEHILVKMFSFFMFFIK
jgi:hypothetical protein